MTQYQKTVLSNGVRVVTEHHPHSRAVASGVFVGVGTRDEPKEVQGVCHFLEHLTFKGTKKRTAYQLARVMEAVGGDLNAHTTREYTCFHSLCLKEHLDLSLEVLSDLVTHAELRREEMERERQVVLQEIAVATENTEEFIFDVFFEKFFQGSSLGKPILGTEKTIAGISAKQVRDFYNSQYAGSNIVVSVAGNLKHDHVVEVVEKNLGRNGRKYKPRRRQHPRTNAFREIISKPGEQVHVLLGFPTVNFKDTFRFEAYIVNSVLAGGMTSRLFQRLRESRGLVYTVDSMLTTFTDSGLNTIYAATHPRRVIPVIRETLKELRRMKDRGIRKSELKLHRTQVKGSIILGSDDVDNRMNSLGINELVFGKYRSVDEVISEIDAVELSSVQSYLEKFLNPRRMALLLVGPIEKSTDKILKELE